VQASVCQESEKRPHIHRPILEQHIQCQHIKHYNVQEQHVNTSKMPHQHISTRRHQYISLYKHTSTTINTINARTHQTQSSTHQHNHRNSHHTPTYQDALMRNGDVQHVNTSTRHTSIQSSTRQHNHQHVNTMSSTH
jgi:hypothetical protein